jgi:hypothetical protein
MYREGGWRLTVTETSEQDLLHRCMYIQHISKHIVVFKTPCAEHSMGIALFPFRMFEIDSQIRLRLHSSYQTLQRRLEVSCEVYVQER